MITSSTKKNVTTYKFKDYSVSFTDTKPKGMENGFCLVTMKNKNIPVFDFHYFYNEDYARLEEIHPRDRSRIGSSQAAKELDFMFHCLEKHLIKQKITAPRVRTHTRFAKFLIQRGWALESKQKTAIGMTKRLTKRNNFLPSVMGGKWKSRRALAQKKLK